MDELPFNEKLKHIIESHFDMLKANAKLPLLIISEFSRRPEQIHVLKEKLKNLPQELLEKLNADLEKEIEAGRIRPTTLMDLIITMASLNISLFLLMPIASQVISLNETQQQFVIEHRRDEHVKTDFKQFKTIK